MAECGAASVHVASLDLSQASVVLPSDLSCLFSQREIDRADRFATVELRSRYLQRRAFLRRLIARQVGMSPESLNFDTTCSHCGDRTHGKPTLDGYPHVAFSASSRANLVVVAIAVDDNSSGGLALGIDIERLDSVPAGEVAELAQTVFSAAERERLGLTGAPATRQEFAAAFVVKEALGKAVGAGLLIDIAELAEPWVVRPLDVAAPYVGVLAADREVAIRYLEASTAADISQGQVPEGITVEHVN